MIKTPKTVEIKCEGSGCNNGISAKEMEDRLVAQSPNLDAGQAHRQAAAQVTASLPYRRHVFVGRKDYQCTQCGNVRTWG